MKILITTPGLKFGGAERVISIMANQWVNMGHEVSFFLTVSKEYPVYNLDANVRVRYCEQEKYGFGIPGVIRGIRTYAKEIQADIAISFMQDVAALTAIALFNMKIPLVYSERNDPNKTNNRKVDYLFRKIVENRAAHFVFQTEGAKSCFKKSVQRKSSIILNPLDTEMLPIHNFNEEQNEIVAVGRMEEQKNYPVLFRSFKEIADEYPDINLSVYGDGSLRKQLELMIQEMGMQGRIITKGQVHNIYSHTKDAKAFVMTSDYEGLPNALMEALSMGLPCISTDCSPGGARMLIEDGKNGYVVPCGDTKAVASRLRKILSDRECARQMGQNATEFRKRVDSKVIAKTWLRVFEDIMELR